MSEETSNWFDGRVYKNCVAIMPFVRWAIVVGMFAFGAYIYQRDTNAQSIVSVVEIKKDQESIHKRIEELNELRDRQLDVMDKKILTREVYEAYHASDSARIERIEKLLEQIIVLKGR